MTIRIRPPYLVRVFDGVSQLANIIFLNGNPNESISGRAHREGWKRTEKAINTLCFWESDHCSLAYLNDISRARDVINQHDQRI